MGATTALFGELVVDPADELFRRFLECLSTELRSKCCRRNGRSFPASNSIFKLPRPYARPYCEESKIPKNRKNLDLCQMFNF